MFSTRSEVESKSVSVFSEPKPHQKHSKIKQAVISDGVLFTVERSIVSGKDSVLVHQNEVKPTVIQLDKTIEELIPIPGGNFFMTLGESKKSISLSLWSIETRQVINAVKIKDEDIDCDGVNIFCTKNYLVLTYQSLDISNGKHHDVIELRDVKTFNLFDKQDIARVYGGPYNFPEVNPNEFFFLQPDGFEQWKIQDDKLKKIDAELGLRDIGLCSFNMLADGKTIVTGGSNGDLYFWSRTESEIGGLLGPLSSFSILKDHFHIRKLEPKGVLHADSISTIAVAPDKKHLVTWCMDGVLLWNIENVHKPQLLKREAVSKGVVLGRHGSVTKDGHVITNFGHVISFPEIVAPKVNAVVSVSALTPSKQGMFDARKHEDQQRVEGSVIPSVLLTQGSPR